jgi:hypothetical protein
MQHYAVDGKCSGGRLKDRKFTIVLPPLHSPSYGCNDRITTDGIGKHACCGAFFVWGSHFVCNLSLSYNVCSYISSEIQAHKSS